VLYRNFTKKTKRYLFLIFKKISVIFFKDTYTILRLELRNRLS